MIVAIQTTNPLLTQWVLFPQKGHWSPHVKSP